MKGRLLIIDDEPDYCSLLERQLGGEYDVTTFSDPAAAVGYLTKNPVDVIVTDIRMPEVSGIDILRAVKSRFLNTDVVLMSAFATVNNAVEAMKEGAYDYIVKPFDPAEISLRLKRLFEKRALLEENKTLSDLIDSEFRPEKLIGTSPGISNIFRFIERMSHTAGPVLITGESGAGKQLVAKTIHISGRKIGGKFISVHCSSFSEGDDPFVSNELRQKKGLFEEANGGTLLLREIGDMSMALQSRLLGHLENGTIIDSAGREGPIDVLVIATSNRDLHMLIEDSRFRRDLFYRLSAINMHMPPLRERYEDIPLLSEHILARLRDEFNRSDIKIAPAAIKTLQNYDWPGNVRQLRNLLMKICLLAENDLITPMSVLENLPRPQLKQSPLPEEAEQSLEGIEKNFVIDALKKSRGNMTVASRTLNISYDKLRYKMKKFGIDKLFYKYGR